MLFFSSSKVFASDETVDEEKEHNPLSYGGEVDFVSRYVWRGLPFSDGPALEPSVWVSLFGFSVSAWGNFALTDARQGKFDEVDFYFAYEKEVKNLVIKPTLALYVYPNVADSPTTGELQLHLTYNLKDFRFFTHQQMDIATYRFAYFGEYGAGYQYTIHPKLKFDTEASFGMGSAKFNEVYLGFSKTTASTFNYNIGFKYNPWKFLYLKPHFSTTALLNADERNALNKDVWVYGGLALGAEF